MRQHHAYSTLTNLVSTAAAALLGVAAMGLQSNDASDGMQSDLNSILALYRDGAGGLGIPTMFFTGTPPERSVGVGDANQDGRCRSGGVARRH